MRIGNRDRLRGGWGVLVLAVACVIAGCDGGGGVNVPPVASTKSVTVAQDHSIGVTLPATDSEDNALTFSIVTAPSHGTVTIDGSTATYTPAAGYVGADTFTFVVNDGTADSNVATVTITVKAAANHAPTAANQSANTTENAAVTITLNAADADTDDLTFAIVSNPTHGTLKEKSSGVYVYTPTADYVGSDAFTYKANDGTADSNVATVTITVKAAASENSPPTVSDQAVSTPQDASLDITLAGVDDDGDSLTFVIVSWPKHGALTKKSATVYTYTPATDYAGADSFSYKANDGASDSTLATVSITVKAVAPVNTAPTVADQAVSTPEDTAVDVALSGSDANGDTLTFAIVTVPTHGTLTKKSNTVYTYTPSADYSGSDNFTYKANDGQVDSNVATVSVTVTVVVPANTAPTVADQAVSTPEDTAVDVTFSGSDADSDPLTYVIVANPSHGTLTKKSNTVYTYTPNADYSGSDNFTYKANDGTADSNVATVSVTVTATTPVNTAPTVADQAVSTSENTAVDVTLSGSDADSDPLTYVIVANPSHGTLTKKSNTVYTYTPNATYSGSDSFTYKANDGSADSNVATVSIDVGAQPWLVHMNIHSTNAIDGNDEIYVDTVAASDGSAVVGGTLTNGESIFGAGESGEAILDPTSNDIFLAKYGPDGTLAWAMHDGGTGNEAVYDLTVFSDDSLAVAGTCPKGAVFGQGGTVTKTMASGGVFIARYSGQGVLQWANVVEKGRSPVLASCGDNGSVVAGAFDYGSVTVNKGEADEILITGVNGKICGFVAKHNESGEAIWARGMRSANPVDVGCSSDGSVIVLARARYQTVLDVNGAGVTYALGNTSEYSFVAKYNSAGELQCVVKDCGGSKLGVYPDGSFIVFGKDESDSESGTDAFLAKYSSAGVLQWAKVVLHCDGEYPRFNQISCMANGSVIISGNYQGEATFGEGDPDETTFGFDDESMSMEHAFVAKYRADGSVAWAKTAGGTDVFSAGTSVTVLSDGSCFWGGCFYGTSCVFGADEANETCIVPSPVLPHMFLAKLNPDGTLAGRP